MTDDETRSQDYLDEVVLSLHGRVSNEVMWHTWSWSLERQLYHRAKPQSCAHVCLVSSLMRLYPCPKTTFQTKLYFPSMVTFPTKFNLGRSESNQKNQLTNYLVKKYILCHFRKWTLFYQSPITIFCTKSLITRKQVILLLCCLVFKIGRSRK